MQRVKIVRVNAQKSGNRFKTSSSSTRPSQGAFGRFAPSGEAYNPARGSVDEPIFNWLKGYLNGMHDNNYCRNPGAPISSGSDRIVKHLKLDIDLGADANGRLSLVFTGLLEAPLLQYDTATHLGKVVSYSTLGTLAIGANSSDWMKANGVDAYRCVGLSYKCVDETKVTSRTGHVMSATLPSMVDIQELHDTANGFHSYIRLIETPAAIDTDISSATANVYSAVSEEGVYRPLACSSWDMPFVHRDRPINKAVWGYSSADTNINTSSYMQNPVAFKYGANMYLPGDGVMGNAVSVAYGGVWVNTIPVSLDSMDSGIVLFTNVDSTFACHVSVASTWEFVCSQGSPFAPEMSPPLKTNFKALLAASLVFRGMPGGYPASANFWNEIWDKFKSVYNSIEPVIEKAIPYANYVIPGASSVLGPINKAIQSLVEDKKEEKKEAAQAQAVQSLVNQAMKAPPQTVAPRHGRY